MLNIFNLFLFLFTLWIVFIATSGHISLLYLISGIFAALLVAILSKRLKLIDKKSEMLYLSFGFYRHFIKLFLQNFLPSLRLLLKMAFKEESIVPVVHKVKNYEKDINLSAFISTINIMSGLLVIDLNDGEIAIHATNEDCLKNLNLKKTQQALQNINDDNLV